MAMLRFGPEENQFVEISDIIRLEAQQSYTVIRVDNILKRYLFAENFGYYCEHLKPYTDFKRVHRSHIVNKHYVVKYVRSGNYLLMQNGDEVPVSRRRGEVWRGG